MSEETGTILAMERRTPRGRLELQLRPKAGTPRLDPVWVVVVGPDGPRTAVVDPVTALALVLDAKGGAR